MSLDILMVGVGGQGVVLASNIACEAAFLAGFDVKKSEAHGMSQRGGSVFSHVRIGEKVYSPVIPAGEADIILSFERMEFLRYLNYAWDNTSLILNSRRINPLSTGAHGVNYPNDLIDETLSRLAKSYELDAYQIASTLGNPKVEGVAMLGALGRLSPVIDKDFWLQAIKMHVPGKYFELNIEAFETGYEQYGE